MSNYKYAPLEVRDLERVWQIESCAHSHPWQRSMIDDLNSRGAMHFGMFDGDILIGYFYAQNIVGEVSLLNVAVAPEFQGQGVGSRLVSYLIQRCERLKVESIWLEVRESNVIAQNLYLNSGFNEVDRRRGYYPTSSGREDAILMSYYV
ncbi:ribosomal protein S18-alanine N-acetyltransferase [Vibrio gallicus]|uniref:ribosomal protein S18-alanine N-acetyltransferase n=1 Tax=Vibrio gallicus TaxID=190897 RepID=UPI0021C31DEB|nr:ribosomal protein S18-alanine N-acetyltransferase [Vibrio gallicus]